MNKETDLKIQEILLSKFKENDERIDNWIKTVAKNHYYKNSLFIDEFGILMSDEQNLYSDIGRLADIQIINYMNENTNLLDVSIERDEHEHELFSKIRHLIDYLKSDSAPTRISRLSFSDADRLSVEWLISLNKKSSTDESKDDIKFLKSLSNDYFIVKLITEQAYKREGKIMGHCIASYYHNDSIIYSLRDKENNPCCTVETLEEEDDNQILEIEGKFNKAVQDKHISAAKEMISFLASSLNVLPESIDDLDKIKSFALNDKIISISELSSIPENTIVNSYLFLHTEEKLDIKLSKGLIFKNSINIKTNGVIHINDGVIFEKKLTLNSKEISFSKSANFKGDELRIIECEKFSKFPIIPDELNVLSLDKSNINYIPKNLKSVNLLSFCDNKSIKKIDNICAQSIDLRSSGIKSIGKNVVAQKVILTNTKIRLKDISSDAQVSKYKIDEGHEIRNSLKYKFLKEEVFSEIKFLYSKFKYNIGRKFRESSSRYVMNNKIISGVTGSGKSDTLRQLLIMKDNSLPVIHIKEKSKILFLKEKIYNKSRQYSLILRRIFNRIFKLKHLFNNKEKKLSLLAYSRYQIMGNNIARKVNYKNTTFEYNKENMNISGIISNIKRGLSNNVDIRPSDEPAHFIIFDEYGEYSANNQNRN
jgi:hypothetical protein